MRVSPRQGQRLRSSEALDLPAARPTSFALMRNQRVLWGRRIKSRQIKRRPATFRPAFTRHRPITTPQTFACRPRIDCSSDVGRDANHSGAWLPPAWPAEARSPRALSFSPRGVGLAGTSLLRHCTSTVPSRASPCRDALAKSCSKPSVQAPRETGKAARGASQSSHSVPQGPSGPHSGPTSATRPPPQRWDPCHGRAAVGRPREAPLSCLQAVQCPFGDRTLVMAG